MGFERRGNAIYFDARLEIDKRLRDTDPVGLARFLEDPKEVMAASWPKERIRALDTARGGDYRLFQEPINFAGLLEIDFFVDVHLEVDPRDGLVTLRSYNVETTANGRPVKVNLEIEGALAPVVANGGGGGGQPSSLLRGHVSYKSSGELIGPLILCPDVVLRTAVAGVNKAILTFARRDFVKGIQRNFRAWEGVAGPARAAPVPSIDDRLERETLSAYDKARQ